MKVYVFKRKTMYKIAALIIIIACVAILPKPNFDKLVETATKTKKKVPIYCVETDKKQIAVSFDAAWEAIRYRQKNQPANYVVDFLFY